MQTENLPLDSESVTPINIEGGGVLDTPDPNPENPLNIKPIPGTLFNQLMNPPDFSSFRFTWHGKDILGNKYSGYANTTQECHDAAALLGAVNCFNELNPDFVEPETKEEIQPDPNAAENNFFYAKGYEEADQKFQDLKTMILAWVTEQMGSSNPGFAQEVESLPFVQYVRFNS